MRCPRSARDATAGRLTAVLCLALVLGLAWGLYHWTLGFEVWTFEARRQVRLLAGELQAPAVTLRGIDGAEGRLWHDPDAPAAAYLVDFIYTRCTSVCSALGSEYAQMQRELAAPPDGAQRQDDVHLVSISFDLDHDDPATLARYAAQRRADPRRWTLGVPATAEDARALLRALGVIVVPDGLGGFVHNGAIHLLDERGRLRGLYELDQWPQALAAAHRLAATRREALR